MHLQIIIISFLLLASTLANAYFLLKKRLPRGPAHSLELQAFLADLMSGQGVVAVSRIDPDSILLRSPGRLK